MLHKILYDPECPLCVRFASAIRGLDHKNQFQLVNLLDHYQTDSSIPVENLRDQLHVIADNGDILVGEKAFDFIMGQIPAAKPLNTLINKTSTGTLFSSSLNRLKRWTKSRYSLNTSCWLCHH
tara:strand:- start:8437 stop:8805 length:369 start_codon:yes stop_codon:yes gene_type:complete